VRNAIDEMQDIYFLRKRALVDDHHWRTWVSAFIPIARIPFTRDVFENAASRQALEPEFEAFFRSILEGKPVGDARLNLMKRRSLYVRRQEERF
jgi:hypothetical protein